jgi:hypothetical protein
MKTLILLTVLIGLIGCTQSTQQFIPAANDCGKSEIAYHLYSRKVGPENAIIDTVISWWQCDSLHVKLAIGGIGECSGANLHVSVVINGIEYEDTSIALVNQDGTMAFKDNDVGYCNFVFSMDQKNYYNQFKNDLKFVFLILKK